MVDEKRIDKTSFLYPYHRYRGQFSPSHLAFNANLQEFAHQIGYICALQTQGKLSTEQAYQSLEHLWQQLEQSSKELGIKPSRARLDRQG